MSSVTGGRRDPSGCSAFGGDQLVADCFEVLGEAQTALATKELVERAVAESDV